MNNDETTLQLPFVRELVQQWRAQDQYGMFDKKSDAELIAPYIITREQRRRIPIIANPDERILNRVEQFYDAVGTMISRRANVSASPIIKLHFEGFGRMVMLAGRLVILTRHIRDIHRFGFETIEKMAEEGEKLVETGLEMINAFPDVVNYNN